MVARESDEAGIGETLEGDVREPALACPQESARTPELEIDFGQVKTARVLFERLEALRFGALAIGREEEAVALLRSTTYTAAELVELREAEALSPLDQHDGRIGDVDPNFDHGCRDEDVECAVFEGAHDRVFLGGFHSAMQETNTKVGENLVLESSVFRRRGFDLLDRFALFDQGEDDEGLAAFFDFVLDKGVDFLALGIGRGDTRDDGLLVRWHFIQEREVEIAEEGEREGAGDGRRCHAEKMRRVGGRSIQALECQLLQLGPLRDAEAMLLIYHDEGELAEVHLVFEEGMGADDDIGDAGLYRFDESWFGELIAIELAPAPGEEGDLEAFFGEELGESLGVLDGQDFGRGEEGSLIAGLTRRQYGEGRDHCLAASHIAVEESIHRMRLPEVFQNFFDGFVLSAGEFEGESFEKSW